MVWHPQLTAINYNFRIPSHRCPLLFIAAHGQSAWSSSGHSWFYDAYGKNSCHCMAARCAPISGTCGSVCARVLVRDAAPAIVSVCVHFRIYNLKNVWPTPVSVLIHTYVARIAGEKIIINCARKESLQKKKNKEIKKKTKNMHNLNPERPPYQAFSSIKHTHCVPKV